MMLGFIMGVLRYARTTSLEVRMRKIVTGVN